MMTEGGYGIFAGRDASRMDDLSDLTSDELESLNEWFEFFKGKYRHVGMLVNDSEQKK
jgi:hypothetical protein